MNIRFIHSGWGGDRVTGGAGGSIDKRLARDVLAYHPTVVTVMLGMNDGEYRAFDAGLFGIFTSGYEHIVAALKSAAPGIRITVLQPSPYDDVTRAPEFASGYNSVLVRYGAFVRELALREKLTVADLNTPVVKELRTADKIDHDIALSMIPDRVHPLEGVHLVMAEALLKAWNAPALVSEVAIDAAAGTVLSARNTAVREVASDDGLSWLQTDDSLPMPLDKTIETIPLALRSSDFVEALNRESLKVLNLAKGAYTLRIDGQTVGTFSERQLADGLNLSVLDTPMAKQAAMVHDLTLRHNNLHFASWRILGDSLATYQLNELEPSLKAMDRLENQVIALQRATARPKPHRYELTRERALKSNGSVPPAAVATAP
jgi:lysophospholipase L1-like esterase